MLNDDRYCTYIYYPQLLGIEDAEKEKRINLLIEKDVKKILQRDIVSFIGDSDYNEYSMEIEVIKDILREEFLVKIGEHR